MNHVNSVMSDDDLKYDCLHQLTTHAVHLNSIDTPNPAATAKYEIMSGALIWSDETNTATPVYVIWALRQLFAYRTHLMLENAEPDNAFWNKCVALFPKWVGFFPKGESRPQPSLLNTGAATYRLNGVCGISINWVIMAHNESLSPSGRHGVL